jgi:hypothetical protein
MTKHTVTQHYTLSDFFVADSYLLFSPAHAISGLPIFVLHCLIQNWPRQGTSPPAAVKRAPLVAHLHWALSAPPTCLPPADSIYHALPLVIIIIATRWLLLLLQAYLQASCRNGQRLQRTGALGQRLDAKACGVGNKEERT